MPGAKPLDALFIRGHFVDMTGWATTKVCGFNTDGDIIPTTVTTHDRAHSVVSANDHSDWPATVSMEEVGCLDGMTGNIKTALDGKLGTGGTAVDSDKLGGVLPAGYLGSGGTAVDSSKLGGVLPAGYLGSGGTAVDSDKVDGLDASAFASVGDGVTSITPSTGMGVSGTTGAVTIATTLLDSANTWGAAQNFGAAINVPANGMTAGSPTTYGDIQFALSGGAGVFGSAGIYVASSIPDQFRVYNSNAVSLVEYRRALFIRNYGGTDSRRGVTIDPYNADYILFGTTGAEEGWNTFDGRFQIANKSFHLSSTSSIAASARLDPAAAKGTCLVFTRATAGDAIHQLGTAVGKDGRLYIAVKTDSTGNAVGFKTTLGQGIDGSTTSSITTQYRSLMIASDGANWFSIQPEVLGGGNGIPAGVIVMWSGIRANIPSGWALCDGDNGTPDLRGRFVKSVAGAAEPGGTGGSATHTHAGATGTPSAVVPIQEGEGAYTAETYHTHSFTTDASSNEPEYYELAFIMKL